MPGTGSFSVKPPLAQKRPFRRAFTYPPRRSNSLARWASKPMAWHCRGLDRGGDARDWKIDQLRLFLRRVGYLWAGRFGTLHQMSTVREAVLKSESTHPSGGAVRFRLGSGTDETRGSHDVRRPPHCCLARDCHGPRTPTPAKLTGCY